ncbi:PhoX family protein [Spiribacter halobius]|uniref:PhoX family protein n=1 Tax=Sediminicurvatus halobius TaxID=2182432 RepID=UPI001E5EF32D|nr:PhoX family phosphatase [Spiribacter halobius]UEX76467.1 PhoX family phosphatase [Spiribacter halobius]
MSAVDPRAPSAYRPEPESNSDPNEPVDNPSTNPTFAEVLERRCSRRDVLRGSLNAVVAGLVVGSGLPALARAATAPGADHAAAPLLGFEAIPVDFEYRVQVPRGYRAQAFLPWGTPICGHFPAYRDGGGNSGADQECQVGYNHDGMHYFPLDGASSESHHGVLCINHEYIQPSDLHPNGPTVEDGVRTVADEVRKEIAAHGVSVVEIRRNPGSRSWEVVRGTLNRRITASTPMEIAGPARGSALLRTRFSPEGTRTRGTVNNCANGYTPWGTYLTCEENFHGYFLNTGEQPREHARYGVAAEKTRYGWESVRDIDEFARFDATPRGEEATADYRNEPNTFGWVVEIDPMDPEGIPVKRTALGRFRHEGAWMAPPVTGRPLTVYMGDDARFEYIYKFVTREPYNPRTASGALLDEGTLYVARFHDDGTGEWVALDFEDPRFRAAAREAGVTFADQADVLVNTRTAADVVGATKMDRPEWGTVNPQTGEVYMTLTNNSEREPDQTNAANPRGPNAYGQIIRWREAEGEHHATRFEWDLFVVAGPPDNSRIFNGQPLDASNVFNSPDGLWFDPNGVLWIQTDGDQSEPFGNNQMLAADPRTGEIRRFFTGARDCEVTGVDMTPDGRTMFVNVQHPGGSWPDGGDSRPRPATVIVTRDDGGLIGL